MATVSREKFADIMGGDIPDDPTYKGNFRARALPYAMMGIPVFPLVEGQKHPGPEMSNWPELATTDVQQVVEWHRENH